MHTDLMLSQAELRLAAVALKEFIKIRPALHKRAYLPAKFAAIASDEQLKQRPKLTPAGAKRYYTSDARRSMVVKKIARQVEDATEALGDPDMPLTPHTRKILQLRIDNPTAGYVELAKIGGMTKDTITGVMRRTRKYLIDGKTK